MEDYCFYERYTYTMIMTMNLRVLVKYVKRTSIEVKENTYIFSHIFSNFFLKML